MAVNMRHIAAGLIALTLGLPDALRAQPYPAMDSAVAGALRTATMREIELVGPARPFAPGRYFAVAVLSRSEQGTPVQVRACTVDSAATTAVACVPLVLPRLDANLLALDTLYDRAQTDLDGDGNAELRFRVSYTTRPEPAVGPDMYERYFVFRASPALTRVLALLVTESPGASAVPHRFGTVEMRDDNADGTPDIVLQFRLCPTGDHGPEDRCRPRRQVYLYRAATRTWVLAPGR